MSRIYAPATIKTVISLEIFEELFNGLLREEIYGLVASIAGKDPDVEVFDWPPDAKLVSWTMFPANNLVELKWDSRELRGDYDVNITWDVGGR